jgi:uncharacterized protein YidB (DUF937 family)
LGDAVKSWIGTGANQPVTPAQLHSALGDEHVGRIAEEAGVSKAEAAQGLSQLLPNLIDHLTPQGQLPDSSSLDSALEGIGNQIPN